VKTRRDVHINLVIVYCNKGRGRGSYSISDEFMLSTLSMDVSKMAVGIRIVGDDKFSIVVVVVVISSSFYKQKKNKNKMFKERYIVRQKVVGIL